MKAIGGLFYIMVAAAPAAAQERQTACPDRPADGQIARNLAGSFFASAERSFKENRFNDALAKFVCSLRMMDHENTLFNIAHVTLFVEDKRAALALFENYVADHPKGRTAREMRKMIAELKQEVGETGPPAVTSAAEPVPDASEPVAAAPEESAPAEPGGAAPETTTPDDGRSRLVGYLKIGGWVGVGTGAAFLVIGAVLQGVAASAEQSALDATSYDRFREERDRRDRLQSGAIAGFVLAGVLGGAGAFLLLWDFEAGPKLQGESGPRPERGLELSLVPGPAGVALKGRF